MKKIFGCAGFVPFKASAKSDQDRKKDKPACAGYENYEDLPPECKEIIDKIRPKSNDYSSGEDPRAQDYY